MIISEIGAGFFHFRSAETVLHRNIYVKRFERGRRTAALVFDPGAKADVPALLDALTEIAGGVDGVGLIFVSHQDPDVASNAKFLVDNAPWSLVLCSVDAWRLIKLVGVPDNRFYLLDNVSPKPLRVRETGHTVVPVPAPYCHFRGSIMLYDPESRVLFSGDLFAGVDTRRGQGVYADEGSWEGVSLFHQIYMPCNRAVRETLARIEALEPFPEVIAPQHGDVIRGPLVREFITRLSRVDVGVDMPGADDADKVLAAAAVDAFFEDLRRRYPETAARLWEAATRPDEFTSPFRSESGRVVGLTAAVPNAVAFICSLFDQVAPMEQRDNIMLMLVVALENNGLAVPNYCLLGDRRRVDVLDVAS